MLALWCTAAAVCLALVWVRGMQVWRHWERRGIPHNPPHPLLGSLTFITKQNPAEWMRGMYSRFQSPYAGIWLGWQPVLVINCPKLARNIMVADSEVFRDRFVTTSSNDPMGLNLFTCKEPLWSSIRKRLNPAFTSAKLRAIETTVDRKCQEIIKRIHHNRSLNKIIDLREMYSDFTTDVIGIAAFGVEGDATLKEKSVMREVTKQLLVITPLKGLELFIVFFIPWLSGILRCRMFSSSIINYFHKIFKTAVAQRGGYEHDKREVTDLLDALIVMKRDAAKAGEELSEELLLAQAVLFLFGGFDTSATALTFATYEIAHAPLVQKKMYEEILRKTQDVGHLDSKSLSEMKYLNCVIKETLRKYPVIGWLERVAAKEYRVDDNLTIEAGTPVYINNIGIHYDNTIYTDPETFDPERFLLDDDKGKLKPFLAFGDGPRHCIGQRFALQTLRYALSAVVFNFELRPFPNSPKPVDVKIEKNSIFIVPENALSVKFVPRKIN